MHFSTLVIAAIATFAAAVPTEIGHNQQLNKREPVCGYFYDTYLGSGTGWYVYGDFVDKGYPAGSHCQELRKPGENPNDKSIYRIVLDNPQCSYCIIYPYVIAADMLPWYIYRSLTRVCYIGGRVALATG